MPGTDIFLNTIIHWPKRINQNQKEGSIVNKAALFQSGYFLPKSPEYARFFLAEVFPKYAESSLEQVFAESLSLAVIDPDHIPIVQALLDLGADPNRESHDGISPLTESLLRTNIESVKLLLARGAQIRRDLSSEHPLDILRDEYDPVKHKELFKIFENAM